MTKISFIIVNHYSEKYIPACVSSIKRNSNQIPFEIIIVNNDNSDFSYPETKKINLKKNLGFGNASNAGAKIAQGEILCFLNPDTEILDNLNDLIEHLKSQNDTGIIGANIVDSKGKKEKWSAGFETNFWNLLRNNLGVSKSKRIWNSDRIIECEKVSGCALFVKKDLFDSLNGFDESFFMYFEDEDLCRRVRQKGSKVIFFPDFHVKHYGGHSFKNKIRQKKLYYSSMYYYFKKYS